MFVNSWSIGSALVPARILATQSVLNLTWSTWMSKSIVGDSHLELETGCQQWSSMIPSDIPVYNLILGALEEVVIVLVGHLHGFYGQS